MKKLPVGISNLKEIIEEGYAYIDKFRFVYDLAGRGKYYFLSRPGALGNPFILPSMG